MLSVGTLAFLNPWVLAGLAALPVLWWLLRAIPPSPRRRAFAPVRLLFGLEDEEREADRTPWWLILLRVAALAAAIVAFAQPVLNPSKRLAAGGDGPVLLLMDQGWASAADWDARREAAGAALDEAADAGRQVVFWSLAEGAMPPPAAARAVRRDLDGALPAPWRPDRAKVLAALEDGSLPAPGQTIWLHDGLAHSEASGELLAALAEAAPLTLIGPEQPAPALGPAALEDGQLVIDVLRAGGAVEAARVVAIARDENGAERRVGIAVAEFGADETSARATFDLPREIVQRVSRLVLADAPSAGASALATGAIRRISAGIVDPGAEQDVMSLTSARYYLTEAMLPWADVTDGDLPEMLGREPAAILLADQGEIPATVREDLEAWVEAGGLLVRFAGPRLAASIGERFGLEEDALLPVRLRRGGRVLGGALSWSQPKRIGAFPEESPFLGLPTPDEIAIQTQVLADPAPDLSRHVWARLDDGSPLVTGRQMGDGHVVLFHVTADADWSSLPLSGLFVEMLGRLTALAPGQIPEPPSAEALEATLWRADTVIGTDGAPRPADPAAAPVQGERLATRDFGPGMAPGLYARVDGGTRAPGEAGELVLQLYDAGDTLAPLPDPPAGTVVETLGGAEAERLGQWFLIVAITLAIVDVLATLWISGRLAGLTRPAAGTAGAVLLATGLAGALALGASEASAQERRVEATAETTLGYLITGESEVDRISERAMVGLANAMTQRTAVEPGPPMGVDPETDDLSFYPVIYWPLTGRTVPSDEALARLAAYLEGGGMLLIDTQNGASGFGRASASEMRRLARALNLPPLEPVDGEHVLTRTFYLLDRFPGRWRGGEIWAEAGGGGRPEDADAPEIPRFDRVDDNVSPVIVGSADWAAAWAVDEQGMPLFAVGRAGDGQREMALRFGVNLVMYALTGNYKSDQVHAPEVLRRLGQ